MDPSRLKDLRLAKATAETFTPVGHDAIVADTTMLIGGIINPYKGPIPRYRIVGIVHEQALLVMQPNCGSQCKVLGIAEVRSALPSDEARTAFDLEHAALRLRARLCRTNEFVRHIR